MGDNTSYIYCDENGELKINLLQKVDEQKFDVGEFVYINNSVPEWMGHFEHGCAALVIASSLQIEDDARRFNENDNFRKRCLDEGHHAPHKLYCLLVRYSAECWSESSWYIEAVLTRIKDKQFLKQYSNEIKNLKY